MYRVGSRLCKAAGLLVGVVLLLYAVLLFGGNGISEARDTASQWVQTLREELPLRRPASEELGWELVLVNDKYSVPDSFPGELVTLKNGEEVDARIYPDLQNMFDAARKEGLELTVRSGYRTKERQKEILEDKQAEFVELGYSNREAKKLAREWVARPGHSEHELGLAVDINAVESVTSKDVLYHWLNQNSWKYGFVCRYPSEKSDITKVAHEPWHYRYVGKTHAKAMYEANQCLEEYLDGKL